MPATLHLRQSAPLEFEIARLGRSFLVPLPTRRQMREAIALDPAEGAEESPADADARRALQLAIFAEGTELPVDDLEATEEVEILHALIAAHHQHDPNWAVALQRTLKKNAGALAAMNAWDALTATPSTSAPN